MKPEVKIIIRISIIIILISYLLGCVTTGFLMAKPKVTILGKVFTPKEIDSNIDVYITTKPEKDYIEVAQITCGDTDDSWNLKQIKMKAREVGADAIIIIGTSDTYGFGVPVGNMTYVTTESYGITAIAIKYK